MRNKEDTIHCDGCGKNITTSHLMCDALEGEWCSDCFGECPCPGDRNCGGKDEGCPTLVTELGGEAE